MYAIGLCLDENYLLPGLVTIMSVAHSASTRERKSIAVRVITNDLIKPHADAIAAFSLALGFGSFDLEWVGLHERYRVVEGARISATTYLRFDFNPGFVQRSHLIYLDCDVLVLDDISSPFNSVGASQLGVVRDEYNSTIGNCPDRALSGFVEDFPSVSGRPYFNAGALWLSTSLMPAVKNGVTGLLAGLNRRYYNDQDAMNIWLLNSGRAVQLPSHLNRFEIGRFLEQGDWYRMVVPGTEGPRHASVLHFVGDVKPWLKCCPTTPGVRLYRSYMGDAQRLLCKLRIQTICVQDDQ
jgi:lipopolysaccharide biosynthesis glycosyltransferase